jgi:hypothetical protein
LALYPRKGTLTMQIRPGSKWTKLLES